MQRLWIQKFERETPKTLQPTLKVGDHVRMVGPRRVFARGYHERWTREVFVVTKVEHIAPIMLQKSREGEKLRAGAALKTKIFPVLATEDVCTQCGVWIPLLLKPHQHFFEWSKGGSGGL